VATDLPFSELAPNDLTAIRDRIDSIGSRGIEELTNALPIRKDGLSARLRSPRVILLGGLLASGILLGLLVLGVWLRTAAGRTAFDPEQSSGEYQQMLVTWAANRYWQTGDASQVQKAFANWNRDDLAKLLLTMQRGTSDVEARRRLVALTEALRLPVSETSVIALIFGQPIIVVSLLLSIAPLLAAFTMVTLPRIRIRMGIQAPEEAAAAAALAQPGESLDELLAEVQAGEETAAPGEEQANEDENKEDEDEKPVEEEESQGASLGDLASLFEVEDTSINALEAFCKGMPEVNIDSILTMGADILRRFRQGLATGQAH